MYKHIIALFVAAGIFSVTARAEESYSIAAIKRLSNAFEHIREYYVEEVTDEELLNLAIHGMLEGLDPHSTYLEPAQFENLMEHTEGSFSGLGLEVDMDGGLVRVVSPIDNTPAAKAGIRAGDMIIKLDDTQVRGLSLAEAIDLMRGERGTSIMLTILREGAKAPLEVELTRDLIEVDSVTGRWLEPGYGYLRIATFQQDTGDELRAQLQQLRALDTNLMKGLIIDLRNNPGGVLQAAVSVSDAFLNTGTIVYTEGRTDDAKQFFSATEGDLLSDCPIVILVNEGSASASEIVAGALQDNHRAVIVGSRSFGKGSVQRVLPLDHDYAIKLTTALYFTPLGRSIQAQGIIPDIVVPLAEVKPIDIGLSLSERSLASHLESPQASDTPETTTSEDLDNQIVAALQILKGAHFLTKQPIAAEVTHDAR